MELAIMNLITQLQGYNMPHAILYKEGSNDILLFIEDAVSYEDVVIGAKGVIRWSVTKADKIRVKWVDDSVPIPVKIEEENRLPYYAEKVSDYTAAVEDGPAFRKDTLKNVAIYMKFRREVADLSFSQLETFIDNMDLNDPVAVKDFLKKLSKALLCHIKISDHYRNR